MNSTIALLIYAHKGIIEEVTEVKITTSTEEGSTYFEVKETQGSKRSWQQLMRDWGDPNMETDDVGFFTRDDAASELGSYVRLPILVHSERTNIR